MLTKTLWRRTRVLLVMIFANDFAHRRNIVAGGEGGRDSRLFFPPRGLGVGKQSRTRRREIASSTLPWLRLMLTCNPQALRNCFYAAAVGYAILVYFFPRRPSSRAKKNSLIAPNGTGARPKTSRIGHALSHEELFSHTFNPSWNAVLDFEKLRLRSLAPDSK